MANICGVEAWLPACNDRSSHRRGEVVAHALFGFATRDMIEWEVLGGTRRLRIGEIVDQPEAVLSQKARSLA